LEIAMLMRLFAAAVLLTSAVACSAQAPAAGGLTEGQDYERIDPPVPTSAPAGKIEVIEVFGYSCVHCANLQPIVDEWKKTLPEDVAFGYMPAVFGGAWEIYGRAYYAAETMGILEQSHSEIFNKIHTQRAPIRSVEDVAGLYTSYGVTQADFLASMQSFAVNAKIARAQQTVQRYGIDATPTMVVNGKYRVQSPREGGFPRMLQIVEALVAQERAAAAAGG
jgi:thiol:disulfide interchange protein DsbA